MKAKAYVNSSKVVSPASRQPNTRAAWYSVKYVHLVSSHFTVRLIVRTVLLDTIALTSAKIGSPKLASQENTTVLPPRHLARIARQATIHCLEPPIVTSAQLDTLVLPPISCPNRASQALTQQQAQLHAQIVTMAMLVTVELSSRIRLTCPVHMVSTVHLALATWWKQSAHKASITMVRPASLARLATTAPWVRRRNSCARQAITVLAPMQLTQRSALQALSILLMASQTPAAHHAQLGTSAKLVPRSPPSALLATSAEQIRRTTAVLPTCVTLASTQVPNPSQISLNAGIVPRAITALLARQETQLSSRFLALRASTTPLPVSRL